MLLSNILAFCFVLNFKKGGRRSDQENRIEGGRGGEGERGGEKSKMFCVGM